MKPNTACASAMVSAATIGGPPALSSSTRLSASPLSAATMVGPSPKRRAMDAAAIEPTRLAGQPAQAVADVVPDALWRDRPRWLCELDPPREKRRDDEAGGVGQERKRCAEDLDEDARERRASNQ